MEPFSKASLARSEYQKLSQSAPNDHSDGPSTSCPASFPTDDGNSPPPPYQKTPKRVNTSDLEFGKGVKVGRGRESTAGDHPARNR